MAGKKQTSEASRVRALQRNGVSQLQKDIREFNVRTYYDQCLKPQIETAAVRKAVAGVWVSIVVDRDGKLCTDELLASVQDHLKSQGFTLGDLEADLDIETDESENPLGEGVWWLWVSW